jgi:hypothetical protein
MGTMMYLLVASALAAPQGFKVTKNTDHCELSLGPALGNGVVPMRAECHFPDVDPDKLHSLMAAFGDHDKYWSSVVSSDVLRTDGSRTWVKQVHAAKGISNREAILVMEKKSVEGGFRYTWTLDSSSLEPASGHVAVEWDDGYWEVTTHPDGGVRAVHQLAYGPGGSVPGFLVRWFQTSGLQAVVQEIEAYAKK